MQKTIEGIVTSLLAGRSEAGPPPERLELAVETGLLTAWVVRSDEVVLDSERQALTRALGELFDLGEELAREVAGAVLSLDDRELPPQRELLARAVSRHTEHRSHLVEALLAVASADGAVHRRELALIRRLAEAVELPEADFQGLVERWSGGQKLQTLEIRLAEQPVTVGRSPENTVQLPSLSVSARHARFAPTEDGWEVEDLGSTTGTWVDGRRVRSYRLHPSNLVQVENFCFRVEPERGRLTLWNENDLLALAVEDLTVEVTDRGTGEPRRILDAVSFTCFSGELIAVTGPSGSGKTTLIHTLLGAAASNGRVRLNGRPCPDLLGRYARRLGLVPQDDIVHGELTVEESLFYSGALRAVPGVGAGEVRDEVDRVVGNLALEKIRHYRIGDSVHRGISGGERKRVNLGQELLNPSTEILILDEPTTGLDPHTGLDIFRLLRKLADQGRLVIVVTHRVERATLDLMDRILALGSGGRLAFFGPPDEAFPFFEVGSVPELFDALRRSERAHRLADRFDRSFTRPTHAESEDRSSPEDEATPEPEAALRKNGRVASRALTAGRQWLRELGLQTLRYARVKARDRTAMLINFGQIPLIVVGCWIVLQETLIVEVKTLETTIPVVPAALPFVLVISAFWLGCVSAVRELVAEQAIHRRERMGGLRTSAYLLSKIAVLSGVTALQCLLLVATTEVLFDLTARHMALGQIVLVLFLVGLVGVGCGLFASALFRTTEASVAILPALVIPQLLFGGVLAPFDEMPEPVAAVSYAMASRWGIDGFVQAGHPGIGANGHPDRQECTVVTIPGTDVQPCVRYFLSSIGLASDPEPKIGPLPYAGFGAICSALAGLAVAALLLAGVALARRP